MDRSIEPIDPFDRSRASPARFGFAVASAEYPTGTELSGSTGPPPSAGFGVGSRLACNPSGGEQPGVAQGTPAPRTSEVALYPVPAPPAVLPKSLGR
ncbi:hypothetical protein [Sorangium cellulosum]|nr:hypothetical protein [Sorangium cellulosum]